MSLMAMALLLSCRGPRQERRASGIIPGIVLSRTVAEKREREREREYILILSEVFSGRQATSETVVPGGGGCGENTQ